MIFFCRSSIGFPGFFWGREATQKDCFFVDCYLGQKSIFSSYNSFWKSKIGWFVTNIVFAISSVLSVSGFSKVCNSVVIADAIDVVNLFFWPSSIDPKPHQPVLRIIFPIYSCAAVASGMVVTSAVTYLNSTRTMWWREFPKKMSCIRVVIQQLNNSFVGKWHGVFKNCCRNFTFSGTEASSAVRAARWIGSKFFFAEWARDDHISNTATIERKMQA